MTMPPPTVAEDTEWSECAALLYHDFTSFAACCFRELNPRTRFLMNWHFEVMAGKLAAVYHGRIRRLMVCVPPRHLKSHLASVCFRRGVWATIRARRSYAPVTRRTSPTNCRAIAGAS